MQHDPENVSFSFAGGASRMSAPVPLHFDRFDVRMIMRNGVPWWVIADICRVIGIKNHRDAAARLHDWQKDDVGISDAIGRRQKTIMVNEAGVYALLLASSKPVGEQFAKWLFTEVLPSIRQFGMYPPPAIVVGQDDVQNLDATPQQRFLAECERLADDAGFTLEETVKDLISAPQLRQIKLGTTNVIKWLCREDRLCAFGGAGMDIQYVINGRRTMTAQERRMIAGTRAAKADQQLLESA